MNHTFISFGLNWTFCKLIVVLLSTETLGVASRSRGKVCRLSARGFWVWHHQETVGRAQGTSLTLHLCLNMTWWSLRVSATISWLIITCMDILWLGCCYLYNLRGTCRNLSPVFPAKKMVWAGTTTCFYIFCFIGFRSFSLILPKCIPLCPSSLTLPPIPTSKFAVHTWCLSHQSIT